MRVPNLPKKIMMVTQGAAKETSEGMKKFRANIKIFF